MTLKEIILLEARINEEVSNIQKLLMELKNKKLLKSESNKNIALQGDNFVLRAVGSILHDFYVAVENVLEMISREIDECTPQGLDWHIKLLKQMSLDVPEVRPAVISKDTLYVLDRFRAFRHVFRNVYGFNLDTNRLKELLEEIPGAAELFTRDLGLFIKRMKAIINSLD